MGHQTGGHLGYHGLSPCGAVHVKFVHMIRLSLGGGGGGGGMFNDWSR